ncbi:MAG: hypothetical protein L0Y72_19455 [Gemmataceae bacterium]|nr:hypothetical protein [Gemmataceae bacterium]MCI0741213.1 hypothetical protein [Gemmataceae bacterium]
MPPKTSSWSLTTIQSGLGSFVGIYVSVLCMNHRQGVLKSAMIGALVGAGVAVLFYLVVGFCHLLAGIYFHIHPEKREESVDTATPSPSTRDDRQYARWD